MGALRRRSARKTAVFLPQAALRAGFRGAARAKRRRGRACRATRVRARRRVSARVRGVLPRNAAAQAGYLGCTGQKAAFFRQKTPFFGASWAARGQKRRKTRPLRGGFLRKTPKTSRVSRRRVTGLGSKRLPSGPPFSGAALSQTKVRRPLSQSKARKSRGEKKKKAAFFCRGKRPSYIAREAPPRIANYAETTPFVILLFRRGRAINVSRRGANPARPRARKGVGPRRDT